MTRAALLAPGLACALLAAACAGAPAPPIDEPELSPAQAALTVSREIVKTAKEALSPLLRALPVAPDAQLFRGVLTERIAAGGYWYCALALDDGSTRWVAVMGEPGVELGEQAEVIAYARASDFHSARTGRTFDELRFGLVTAVPTSTEER